MKKVVSFLGLAVLLCSTAHAQTEIIGGQPVPQGDPLTKSSVAVIGYFFDEGGYYATYCSGTLIARDLVLTAAHCVAGRHVDSIYIGFGQTVEPLKILSGMKNGSIIRTKQYKVHEDFSGDVKNDVALILLAKPAKMDFTPAPILGPASELKIGMLLTLAGFGLTKETSSQTSKALQTVTVTLVKIIDSILVGDQTQRKGACNGDSGGPAYLKGVTGNWIVAGITRGPHENAKDCHHYGEYTYISKHLDFILDTAKDWVVTPPAIADL